MNLDNIKRAHFIGIGGIGVSAIARMMLEEGKSISGSDTSSSLITEELEKLGVKIFYGHSPDNLSGADLVVYTPAIGLDNLEFLKAKKLGIPTLSYPEMLGLVSKDKYTIAVSGAHGKTTTTAMIGTILKDAGLSPTIIVGSLLSREKSNFISGTGKYFVVEACEYKKSFLNLHPRIIVITNIDNDHLDYYGNIENIQKAFTEFVSKLAPEDYLICNPAGDYLAPVLKSAKCKIINYTEAPKDLSLKVIGGHNILNAQAAFSLAKILGVNEVAARRSLVDFNGTWRRFEYKGKTAGGALVYDDYAHHPTELRATLKAAREAFPDKKIICVFQPHLFSRTKLLMDDFAKSFKGADEVLVADIYAAREENGGNIHASDLAAAISKFHANVKYIGSLENVVQELAGKLKSNDILITIGAGDVYKVGEALAQK